MELFPDLHFVKSSSERSTEGGKKAIEHAPADLFGKGPNNGGELCNWENINEYEILKIVNSRIINSYNFIVVA